MTLPGTLTTKRVLGRYRVEYPTNDIPGFEYVGHYDDLEQAGRAMLETPTPGAIDIWDTVERRYINPLDIECVFEDWQKWWWSNRVWWARLLFKLGLRNRRWVNWTINKKLGPEPWWWYVLRHLGIVGL